MEKLPSVFCPFHFQCVVKDLDSERERRWKAEQAAIKLADHVRLFQCQGNPMKCDLVMNVY